MDISLPAVDGLFLTLRKPVGVSLIKTYGLAMSVEVVIWGVGVRFTDADELPSISAIAS